MDMEEVTATLASTAEKRISRKAALAGAAATAGAAALARVQVGADRADAAAEYMRPAAELSGSISIYGQAYNPSQSMVKTPNNPIPHHMLQVVIDEYQALHPKVQVSIVYAPASITDTRVWEVTQLTGDIAPDIMWAQSFWTNEDIGKGWWIPLDPYLASPNPYIPAGHPGHDRWIDEFYAVPTEVKRAVDGHIYVVPYDLVTTFFFYNKNLFDKAGIKDAPATWADFQVVLQKLQKAGIDPYNGMAWSMPQLGTMCLRSYIEGKVRPTGSFGAYTLKDMALAIKHGVFSTSLPQWQSWYSLMGASAPYWSKDWAEGTNYNGTLDFSVRFTSGQLGILEDGSWRFGLLKANTLVNFPWSSFFMPILTKGTGPGQSPYVDGKPAPAIGGATSLQYAITKTAREKKTLPIAVDFLKYMSAPRQAARVIGELDQFLPNEKEVHVNQALAGPLKRVTAGIGEAGIFVYGDKFTTEANDKITKATNQYLLGQISLSQVSAQIQAIYSAMATSEINQYHWT
jgi:ABC-type glycerol-3-phosphate transport system substrate-binding protein